VGVLYSGVWGLALAASCVEENGGKMRRDEEAELDRAFREATRGWA
jgi:hypothetical protein